jgi:hypothetical protein
MGTIVGIKFGVYVRNMALDGGFADGELIGDLFVSIPEGNQSQ